MRKIVLLLIISVLPLTSRAAVIDPGPSAIYTNTQLGPIAFSDLNGTPVNGSTLSLDILFSSDKFVRLFSDTTPRFDINLRLQTDAGTFPGFVTNATAYLIAQNGARFLDLALSEAPRAAVAARFSDFSSSWPTATERQIPAFHFRSIFMACISPSRCQMIHRWTSLAQSFGCFNRVDSLNSPSDLTSPIQAARCYYSSLQQAD